MKRRRAIAIVGVIVGVTISSEGIAAADLLPPQMHTVAGAGSCSVPITSGGPFDLPPSVKFTTMRKAAVQSSNMFMASALRSP